MEVTQPYDRTDSQRQLSLLYHNWQQKVEVHRLVCAHHFTGRTVLRVNIKEKKHRTEPIVAKHS